MLPLDHPIGVFDSGVGGLTVLQALRRKLPGRDFVYVGDTARVPYGRKPPEMVETFAGQITDFLIHQGVEAVVIACNTASAASLPQLAARVAVPVWGVIDPGVDAARRWSRSGHVGVIATNGTIRSGVYQRKLEAAGLTVWARACPMFVHLVEEGLAESAEAELLASHYLADRPGIDTLILGCTHYPLLRAVIRKVVGPSVRLVESSEVTAEAVAAVVGPNGDGPGRTLHYVTGDVQAYRHTAAVIGGVEGHVVPLETADLAVA
jgi:glutamate racemase